MEGLVRMLRFGDKFYAFVYFLAAIPIFLEKLSHLIFQFRLLIFLKD
jgi:hypothetical protein